MSEVHDRGSRYEEPRRKSIGGTLYSSALFLCPPAFRRQFAEEMARDVDETIEEARRAGRPALPALWIGIGFDLMKTVIVQWLRVRPAVLFLCSLAAAIVASSGGPRIPPHGRIGPPAAAAAPDLLALIILACAALLIVAATIVFTVWLSRPLLRRHRREQASGRR